MLAQLLLEHGQGHEAAPVLEPFRDEPDPRIWFLLAQAYFAGNQLEKARELAARAVAWHDAQMKRGWTGAWDRDEATEVGQLHDELVARLEGEEAVVHDHAQRGRLIAHAVNFKLLAGKLTAESPRIAPTLRLGSIEETKALGEKLLAEGKTAEGLCQLATAELRRERLSSAISLFEQAREASPSHFGAAFGYGAALATEHENHFGLVARLPASDAPEALQRIVPDWPALTRAEGRVVCASALPLERFFLALAERGAVMRILPMDVRPVDLPELQELAGERADDDHRSFAALHGLASDRIAVASIGELLDVTPEGWTFAHELAHLAHGSMPDSVAEGITALFQRAKKHRWIWRQYQLRNENEFFAVAYTDFLLLKYGFELGREKDDEGEMQRVFDFIAGLQAAPPPNAG
ncbi:MAG: tetratricopeptide repeat protein [Myxococcales bacterium]|nr:tetratricopeptide repeat protein [Myxococcales bacterium]